MTTIAYREGILAADTAISSNTLIHGGAHKAWRNASGAVMGACGNLVDAEALREWFMAGGARPPPKIEDAEGLLVEPGGKVFLVLGGRKVRVELSFIAIGSGAATAMGAMEAGASAEKAVRIAARYDPATAEPVHLFMLGG